MLTDLNILLAVATAIEQDPIMYSDATLGQERTKYIDWIQKTSSWGGAIGTCQLNIYVFLRFKTHHVCLYRNCYIVQLP